MVKARIYNRPAHIVCNMPWRGSVVGVAWTGGFLKCYAGALMNAALAFIVASPNMPTEAVSAFVAAGVAAHITCSFLTGFLSDWIGRRRTAVISAIMPLMSVLVLCVFADSLTGLLVGNVLKGAYFGLISSLMPVVVAENSPSGRRGGGAVGLQLSMQFGSIFGALCGTAVAWLQDVVGGFAWRLDFLLALFPALLFFAWSLRLPELPNPSRERSECRNSVRGGRLVFRPLLVASAFMALMSLCGMGSIGGFVVVLMGKAGFGSVASNLIVTVIGVLTVFPALIAKTLIDKSGRRFLMRVGTIGVFVGMSGCGAAFALSGSDILPPLAMRFVFAGFYALASLSFTFGPASCAWAFVPEILPGSFRAKGMSIALLCNQAATFFITTFFLPIVERHGYACWFAFFASMSFAYVVMSWFVLPETKGSLTDWKK